VSGNRRRSDAGAGTGAAEAPPRDAAEALARARRHARLALAEALAAVHALLDAGALAARGEASDAQPVLGTLARLLEELRARLEAGAPAGGEPLLAALAEALDAEIARWEARARDDADARAVLRAFLGVRELLWEFGVRPSAGSGGARPARGDPPQRRPARVQRVRVQG
jgi:hypothetical protein